MNDKMSFSEADPIPSGKIAGLISKSGFFDGLNPGEVDVLATWVSAYSFPAGTFILREGDNENCLCILVEGEVNIYKETEPDKHLKIASIKPDESIGEMGVVDGQPFSASVIASEDSMVLVISRDDFTSLTEQHRELGSKLLRKIAETISLRLRSTTGRLADLLSNR